MTLTIPRTSICLLATLLLAAGASAQQSSMQSAPAESSPGQPPSALAKTDSANANSAAGPATPNYADQAFVADALKNNAAQVRMSELAQQKAAYSDVKEFSVRMIEIHTKLNEQLAPLAKQLDVDQNQKPSKEEKKELAQLEQLSGTDFDHAYLQAMAREQAHSVKQFKNAQSATNPYIQKAGNTDEPVLDQHYQVLQKIAQTHNIPLDEKQ